MNIVPRSTMNTNLHNVTLRLFFPFPVFKWNEQMESDFKIKVAEAATAYCEDHKGQCGLTPSR